MTPCFLNQTASRRSTRESIEQHSPGKQGKTDWPGPAFRANGRHFKPLRSANVGLGQNLPEDDGGKEEVSFRRLARHRQRCFYRNSLFLRHPRA